MGGTTISTSSFSPPGFFSPIRTTICRWWEEAWPPAQGCLQDAEGAQAYLGVNATGFPNLAFLLGPNSGLGHSSLVRMMESQVVYLLRVAQTYRIRQKQTAANRWMSGETYNRATTPSCNADWPEQPGPRVARARFSIAVGTIPTIYPGLSSHYRKAMAKFNPGDYEIVRSNRA